MPRSRFNEDAESVAKSIRDEWSQKDKFKPNILTCGLQLYKLDSLKQYSSIMGSDKADSALKSPVAQSASKMKMGNLRSEQSQAKLHLNQSSAHKMPKFAASPQRLTLPFNVEDIEELSDKGDVPEVEIG